jgi:hypothetical protein
MAGDKAAFPLGLSRAKNLARKYFARQASTAMRVTHIRRPDVFRERTNVEDGAWDIHALQLCLINCFLAKSSLRLSL